MKKLSKETIVFFHEGTLNGKAGAYAAWKVLRDDAHYEGVDYCTLDSLHEYDVTGKRVYLIGLAIAQRNIEHLVYAAKSVIFIDHHPSTSSLDEFFEDHKDKFKLIHSTARASCCLSWSHFLEGIPVPRLYLAIEDMQVRPKEPTIPNAYYICIGLSIYFDFISLNTYFKNNLETVSSESMSNLITDGMHYFRFMESLVNSYVSRSVYEDILDRQVPVLNIPKTFVDGCLGILASKNALAFSYTDIGDSRYWSVRVSKESKLDAGKICSMVGGGGSRYNGGFTTHTRILPSDLSDLFKSQRPETVNIRKDIRVSEDS